MFAPQTSFSPVARSNRASRLAAHLCFNAKQSSHYDIGRFGEILAIAMFEDAGFKTFKPRDLHCGDVHAVSRITGEIFTVEVKTSCYSEAYKRWQFGLYRAKKCDVRNAAYVLLLLIAEKTVFTYLLPSQVLGNRVSLDIKAPPETYRGIAAPYRQRDSLSFDVCNEVYSQRLLH